jgi:hypothetical protein
VSAGVWGIGLGSWAKANDGRWFRLDYIVSIEAIHIREANHAGKPVFQLKSENDTFYIDRSEASEVRHLLVAWFPEFKEHLFNENSPA